MVSLSLRIELSLCAHACLCERERDVMVLSPQVLVPEISISLYYSMTANFKRKVLHAYV